MLVYVNICIGFKSLNVLFIYMTNKAAAWILNLKLAYGYNYVYNVSRIL